MSATQARNNFFDIMNAAIYGNQITVVLKNGEEAMTMAPVKKKKKFDWDEYMKNLKTLSTMLTEEDYKDMEETRKGFDKPRFPNW